MPTMDLEMAAADAEVERILALTDEEVLAESRARGEDPHEIAERFRAWARSVFARHIQ